MTISRLISAVCPILVVMGMTSAPNPIHAAQTPSSKPAPEPPKLAPDLVWTSPSKFTLWYDHPATDAHLDWLPVGDRNTCCRIAGGVDSDDTEFESIYRYPRGDMPIVYPEYMRENVLTESMHISLPDQTVYTNYHRDLDLTQAVSHVSYTLSGIHYSRTCFWSVPDRVLVIQFDADRRASYTGVITLTSPRTDAITATTDTLFGSGTWAAGESYSSEIRVQHDGGTLTTNGHEIDFSHCNGLTIISANDDSFGDPKLPTVASRIATASLKSESSMLNAHIQDYRSQNDLSTFSLSGTTPDRLALPTDKRLLLATDGSDPNLESLSIAYLKYQRIASGSALTPAQTPAILTGDTLSDKTHKLLTSETPNLLLQRRNGIQLDNQLTQSINQALLSYNDGEIDLLPGLPGDWKAGYASGLIAGTDFTVDVTWIHGNLATVMIHSLTGKPATVRCGKTTANIQIKAGKSLHLGSYLAPELGGG